jgi:hypothetical protein
VREGKSGAACCIVSHPFPKGAKGWGTQLFLTAPTQTKAGLDLATDFLLNFDLFDFEVLGIDLDVVGNGCLGYIELVGFVVGMCGVSPGGVGAELDGPAAGE